MLDLAKAYLREAEVRLRAAKGALVERAHAYAVRQSQECVELSLKAALRLVGIEYPKKHDVSAVLEEVSGRFPSWFKSAIARMATISSRLAGKRGLAMYGDELRGLGPSELFGEGDATNAVREAEFVFGNVQKLLQEWVSSSRRGRRA